MKAQPFIKWVGGKRRLIPEIRKHAPAKFGSYHEPFMGGGALFFGMDPLSASLSDMNQRLVRTWRAVRDDVTGVVVRLEAYAAAHSFEHYYSVRALDVDSMPDDADVAAWFIYLNKAGFNGLYRVNKKGGFNVPVGRHKNLKVCDAENLHACSVQLQGVNIHHEGFEGVLRRAVSGDFVYFDPPYVPVSKTANFTSYTRDGFTMGDQARLRDVALALKGRGVRVLLSNSDTPEVRELYSDGFDLRRIEASRALNCKSTKRGKVGELLIW